MHPNRTPKLTRAQEPKVLHLIARLWTKVEHTPEQLETLLDLLRPYTLPVIDASLREAWSIDQWSPNATKIREIANRRTEHARSHAAGAPGFVACQLPPADPIFERAQDAIGRMNEARQRELGNRLARLGALDKGEQWAVAMGGAALRAVLVLHECRRLRENNLPQSA